MQKPRFLRAENEALKNRVKELEEKLNTNSHNSSKSPSQDPYRTRRGKKNSSGKKAGSTDFFGTTRERMGTIR